MKKPASEQLVDLEFFLSNPELQKKLLKIPYYGLEMVRRLLDVEWRVHKTVHWNRKAYQKARWKKLVVGGRVLYQGRVYVLLDWQPRDVVPAVTEQPQGPGKPICLKNWASTGREPSDAVVTPEQPRIEDEAQLEVSFEKLQHIVVCEKRKFVLMQLKGLEPSVEAIIRPLEIFTDPSVEDYDPSTDQRVKLDVLSHSVDTHHSKANQYTPEI